MQVGEVLFILLFNCLVILGLFIFQQKILEKKIKQLNKEVQDLEDLVAAIIEEFEEIAEMTESKIFPDQSINPAAATLVETDLSVEPEQKLESLKWEMEGSDHNLVNEETFFVASAILTQNSDHQSQPPAPLTQNLGNHRPVNDPKHQRILDLWEAGNTIEDIAKQLGIGRGEIQLVLGIYRRS